MAEQDRGTRPGAAKPSTPKASGRTALLLDPDDPAPWMATVPGHASTDPSAPPQLFLVGPRTAEPAPHADPVAGVEAATTSRHSTRKRVVLAFAAAVAVLAAVAVGVVLVGDDTPAEPDAAPAAAAPDVQASTEAPTGAAAPTGLERAVVVQLSDPAALVVTERVPWDAEDSYFVRLSAPAVSAVPGAAPGTRSVQDLSATVDGRDVQVVEVPGVEWTITRPAGGGTALLELTYRVQDAVVRSTPAPEGRALAVLTPLISTELGDEPVEVRVDDPAVLTVSCLDAELLASACGSRSGDTWTATLPAQQGASVVLQLDLLQR